MSLRGFVASSLRWVAAPAGFVLLFVALRWLKADHMGWQMPAQAAVGVVVAALTLRALFPWPQRDPPTRSRYVDRGLRAAAAGLLASLALLVSLLVVDSSDARTVGMVQQAAGLIALLFLAVAMAPAGAGGRRGYGA